MMQECQTKDGYVQVPEIVLKGIVHDLANQFQANLSLVLFAQDALSEGDPETTKAFLEKAAISMNYSTATARYLLSFVDQCGSRSDSVDLSSLVHDAAKLGLLGSHHTYELVAPPENWNVECDKTAIFRVFLNLIINARQAMNGNGGVVWIMLEHVECIPDSSSISNSGGFVKISVSDGGCGIPSDCLPKIFDEGFSTKDNGHGVGLALSSHIIKEHGGHISVKSEVGVGTTFEIYLPRRIR